MEPPSFFDDFYWTPMYLAPRDGTRVLLSRKQGRVGPTLKKGVVIGSWGAKRGCAGRWSLEITANHYAVNDDELFGWMPLPEAAFENATDARLHPMNVHGGYDGK